MTFHPTFQILLQQNAYAYTFQQPWPALLPQISSHARPRQELQFGVATSAADVAEAIREGARQLSSEIYLCTGASSTLPDSYKKSPTRRTNSAKRVHAGAWSGYEKWSWRPKKAPSNLCCEFNAGAEPCHLCWVLCFLQLLSVGL